MRSVNHWQYAFFYLWKASNIIAGATVNLCLTQLNLHVNRKVEIILNQEAVGMCERERQEKLNLIPLSSPFPHKSNNFNSTT